MTLKPGSERARVRVGIDARMVYYRRSGGIGQYILGLLDGLRRLDLSEKIVVLPSRKQSGDLGSSFAQQRLWTPCHHRLEQWSLPCELAASRLALLHSPDFIPPLHWPGKRVITIHDLAFRHFPYLLTAESARYYNQVAKATSVATLIIVESETVRKDIEINFKMAAEKVRVVPLAAAPRYRRLSRGEITVTKDLAPLLEQAFFLFVSTIEPRKNIPTLLKAYAIFRQNWRTISGTEPPRLYLVGRDGWLSEDIYALARELGLANDPAVRESDAVIFLGEVSENDLIVLYNRALAFVFPSLYEGFGLTPLEAMACGCPVIAANSAAIPEVVGTAGLLLPAENVGEWASALARAATDEAWQRRMSEAGLRRAADFSWEKTTNLTLAVYREALSL